jgi:hypothetical protein
MSLLMVQFALLGLSQEVIGQLVVQVVLELTP